MEVVAIFISSMVVKREIWAFVIALPVLDSFKLSVKMLVPVWLGLTSSVTVIRPSEVKTVATRDGEIVVDRGAGCEGGALAFPVSAPKTLIKPTQRRITIPATGAQRRILASAVEVSTAGNKDKALHWDWIFRGALECPGTVGRSVDVSVVDAIVVIETWLAEDDGDGIASGHIICSGDTIHANI
jgi:hypothetical protein